LLKNRVLRKGFGPKREEITGNWRKLHIQEFHELYSFTRCSGDKSLKVGWGVGGNMHGCGEM
jgi:hypothetical protein